ncbi:MAG TPA: ribosome silencing factor [Burkholderiales bacterium]|jgi:ribosome-associated protein|nr:ribosome silencing factor [Burkholderiales bacterium]
MQVEALKHAAIEALEQIKARDITVLDVRKMTSLFDFMIIASADSTRQTRALVNNVQDKLRELGARVQGVEGEKSGEWVLIDLGEIIVHVMQPAVRAYYNLETLWGGRPPVPHPAAWRNPPAETASL